MQMEYTWDYRYQAIFRYGSARYFRVCYIKYNGRILTAIEEDEKQRFCKMENMTHYVLHSIIEYVISLMLNLAKEDLIKMHGIIGGVFAAATAPVMQYGMPKFPNHMIFC